eukprot:TRINITY_DN16168_c0_g1_i1.p2 TRINITY_DN16168_c0_g1~~TRINITY_DN16168_c0_g1_i1.p2  ORF type:complete len:804 (-),score=186.42 TRINITY_DN16168_c0_g1_i1:3087-5498(-)
MQILPDFAKRADQAARALENSASSYASDKYSTATQSFADMMNSLAATDARNRGWEQQVTNSVQTMADHYADTARDIPASTSENGQENSTAGRLVSQEDFADLRGELEKYGLNKQDIADLEERVTSDEGITWRELMNQVTLMTAQNSGGQSLDVESKRLLTGFLGRLGFNEGEVKDIVADLDEDKLDAAWQKISAKIATLSPDKTLNVSSDEIKALAKAFNVPGTDKGTLAAFFAGGGKLSLNAAGLQNLLIMLKQASVGQAATPGEGSEKTSKSINEKLQDAISKAMERAGRDELASNHETKTASQSKVLIKKAAEENHGEAAGRVSRPDGKEAGNAETKHLFKDVEQGKDGDAVKNNAAAEQAKGEGKHGDELAATKKAADAASDRHAKERAEATEAFQNKSQNANQGNGDGKSFSGDANTRSNDSWTDFWNKVAKGEASPEKSTEFATVVNNNQTEARATATAERAAQAFRRDGNLARQTMRNLEQAFMKNLGEGQRQLTLRLDPPQMGRVAVLLTVKNNEVSATLRTEKHETGHMLAEQLQQLRHSLEQQGLKVQKLDVQTQMNNDGNQQGWLGMDGHNMAREQHTRQQTLKAWKQMRGGAETQEMLAHDVQHGNVQEQISQGGLHLIAQGDPPPCKETYHASREHQRNSRAQQRLRQQARCGQARGQVRTGQRRFSYSARNPAAEPGSSQPHGGHPVHVAVGRVLQPGAAHQHQQGCGEPQWRVRARRNGDGRQLHRQGSPRCRRYGWEDRQWCIDALLRTRRAHSHRFRQHLRRSRRHCEHHQARCHAIRQLRNHLGR